MKPMPTYSYQRWARRPRERLAQIFIGAVAVWSLYALLYSWGWF